MLYIIIYTYVCISVNTLCCLYIVVFPISTDFWRKQKITLEIHGPDQINNKNLNVICFLILA